MTKTKAVVTKTKELSITGYINQDEVYRNIESVLKDRTPQFITSVVSLTNASATIREADKKSLLGACLTAAALNLPVSPSLGFAFIIPYKDKKSGLTLAQFQMGYKGFIQLAMNSGKFKTLNVSEVKEGEIKSIDRLSGEIDFVWVQEGRDKLKTIGYVAYMKLINGFEKSFYMTMEELKGHGVRFSQSMKKGYGLWVDDFDAMAKKTVIKLLLSKYAPMTTEMARAHESDQAIITDEGYKYIDNKKETPEEIADEKEKKRVLAFIEKAKDLEELTQVAQSVGEWNDDEISKAYEDKVFSLGGQNEQS